MDDRFDQEFYTSGWRRVLPLGPDGIQPYVRASRSSRSPDLRAERGRLNAMVGAAARSVMAVGRLAALGLANRPLAMAGPPRPPWQRGSLCLAHAAARPAARRPAAMRRPSRRVG